MMFGVDVTSYVFYVIGGIYTLNCFVDCFSVITVLASVVTNGNYNMFIWNVSNSTVFSKSLNVEYVKFKLYQ